MWRGRGWIRLDEVGHERRVEILYHTLERLGVWSRTCDLGFVAGFVIYIIALSKRVGAKLPP